MQIQQSVPSQLNILVPFVYILHVFLYYSYTTALNNVNGYLEEIHHPLWHGLNQIQQCVNIMGNIELSNLKWVGSKNEVGNVMITIIYTSYSTDVDLMLDMCWSMFHLWLISNCALLYPYIISVSASYSSRGFLIFSSLFSQGFLIYSLWSLGIYSCRYKSYIFMLYQLIIFFTLT